MCGRYALFSNPRKVGEKLSMSTPESGWASRYNIAPGTEIVGVRYSRSRDERVFEKLWWGYRPHWAGDDAPEPINAKAENLESSNYFRGAFHKHRCLIPADGWYEWKRLDSGKQPWFFAREDRAPLFMAGIWVLNPDDRPACAIITEPARGMAADVHDRMPVVLDDDCLDTWLDPEVQDKDTLRESMQRFEPDAFECWPVSKKVNRPDNDEPALVETTDRSAE